MFSEIWYLFLYQPIFNSLIWIYTNVAGENLGWAVVWLTIFLRLVLLPFTFISERDAERQRKIEEETAAAVSIYRNDPVAQKEEFRKLMKKHHVSPWAKTLTLLFQAILFVLLYQVFIHGISGEKILKTLYSFVDYPGRLNATFLGFDIGKAHDFVWPTITAFYLLISILLRGIKDSRSIKSEIYYIIFFPLFTWGILWFLPMVKALFILTTMIFSDIITILHTFIISAKKSSSSAEESHH
jgi:YidC/Oxa1 family membrane protein insertase